MTDAVITPVALPPASARGSGSSAPARGNRRRPLPLPNLVAPHTSEVVYGLAAVDCRGRVANRAVVTALHWAPGARLDIDESDGLLVVRAHPEGPTP